MLIVIVIDLSHYLPTTERLRRTHKHWGFTCTCALCSSSPVQQSASDSRLRRIRELEVLIYQTHAESQTPVLEQTQVDSTVLAKELLGLYEEEGLDGALVRAYDNLATAWKRKGGLKKAKMWAGKGLAAAALWPGPDSAEGVKMQKILME